MSTRCIRRSVKWHTSPLPTTPIITNLPRRHTTRRRKTRDTSSKQPTEVIETYNYKGKLESLFGVEREFTRSPAAVEDDGGGGGGQVAEEGWRSQAEMLREECNVLSMERKFVLKKLKKNQVRIERTLKSALKSVASGRKKLCEGKNKEVVLEEEVKKLTEKLEELQSSYIGEVNGDCSMLTQKSQKSKGSVDQMEKDYRPFVNNSVTGSASTSKRIDYSGNLSFSNRFYDQPKEPLVPREGDSKCSGRCKVLVRRMAEQVRADTEQWSQMQEMLGQLRQDMQELQTSKDFWETQALASNQEVQSLLIEVEEWKEKAVEYEAKASTLQTEVNIVKGELDKLKKNQVKEFDSAPNNAIISLGKQIEREVKNGLSCRMKGQRDAIDIKRDSQTLSLGKQLAKEKRILSSRFKENPLSDGSRKWCNLVRSPFKDIGNSSSSSMFSILA
ncbi:uncharacterized protein LOC143560424 [Bidens hawaiensis]|uniref:uncharacterized protein LOC143560424 n=1 Tax=Bidens hawaiensis TaxID=980011 RepID=UPI00404AF7C8